MSLICRTYMSETSTSCTKQLLKNTTNIGTIDEFMMRNQSAYVVNQDYKHRLEDLCNDLSLNS